MKVFVHPIVSHTHFSFNLFRCLTCRIFPPGLYFWRRLRANNIRLAVLTASPHLYVDDCLRRHGIYDCFDHVWTVDDFGLTKGEPAIYQMAADRLGVPIEDCTMIDDNAIAIATAKQAGMHTIAVYDDSSRSAECVLRKTADRYIYNFENL